MRLSGQRRCLPLILLFTSTLLLNASTTSIGSRPAPLWSRTRPQISDFAMPILESLRQSIANHPDDFITFETETSANRFIVEHENSYRETERRVILRGSSDIGKEKHWWFYRAFPRQDPGDPALNQDRQCGTPMFMLQVNSWLRMTMMVCTFTSTIHWALAARRIDTRFPICRNFFIV